MRKSLLSTALLWGASTLAQAGGFLTNTNQCVAFLRNPARDAVMAIDGAYSNPAGVGFMSNGWHLGFDIQSAYQTRTAKSEFPLYPYGTVNGKPNGTSTWKEYKGKATAPVIPSLDLARVGNKWFATFHFGITGGGGKCKFDDGIGMLEKLISSKMVPAIQAQPNMLQGYEFDMRAEGRQYYYGGQFGVGYKVLKNLALSVGGRVVYADCHYYGHVQNLGFKTPAGHLDLSASQGTPIPAGAGGNVNYLTLDCNQSAWGFTPIIGIDYRVNDKLNLAAKYEFKTRLRLKNKAASSSMLGVQVDDVLPQFADGTKVAADIPAILTLGAQYAPIKKLRLSAGFHYYFDKQATQYESREEHLDGDGWEVLAGLEYDLNDKWTVSAGWQTTNYGLGDDSRFLRDLSFVTNSHSVGLGTAFRVSPKVRLNVAYFKTFYRHYRKNMADYADLKTTFGKMLRPMGNELETAAGQLQAIISNPNASEADRIVAGQKLGIIQGELGALGAITNGMAGYSTAGFDNFHRTNDVFGIGVEINF